MAEIMIEPSSMDLVGFSGKGLVGRLIRLGGHYDNIKHRSGLKYRDTFSHVGLRVGDNILFESTTLNVEPDILSGEVVKGVSVVNFTRRIRSFKGNITLYPFKGRLTEDELYRLGKFIQAARTVPYERDFKDLINAQFMDRLRLIGRKKRLRNIVNYSDSVFCSELISLALLYVFQQRWEPHFDNFNITPQDFLIKDKYKKVWDIDNGIAVEDYGKNSYHVFNSDGVRVPKGPVLISDRIRRP